MKKSYVIVSIGMATTLALMIVVRSFVMTLPMCGERIPKYPAVIQNVETIDIVMDASICEQIIAMETEDPERTDCLYQKFDADTSNPFGLVFVSRENACSAYGDTEAFMNYFYAIVTPAKLYPLNHYSSGVLWTTIGHTSDEFPAISKTQTKHSRISLSPTKCPIRHTFTWGNISIIGGKARG